jgi:hypothetical protein
MTPREIATALTKAGFQAEQAIDLDLREMRNRLAAFGARSGKADAALIYTTGHGVEVGGTVFLIPGDYLIPGASFPGDCPIAKGKAGKLSLSRRGVEIILSANEKLPGRSLQVGRAGPDGRTVLLGRSVAWGVDARANADGTSRPETGQPLVSTVRNRCLAWLSALFAILRNVAVTIGLVSK